MLYGSLLLIPYAIPAVHPCLISQAFIKTPFFVIQSRFDEWQMGPGEGGIPCVTNQAFTPPYKHSGQWICNR